MHEMHMVRGLFDDLLRLARENGASKVTKVHLRMGSFTEINEEILRHHFLENGKGTLLSGAELAVEKFAGPLPASPGCLDTSIP